MSIRSITFEGAFRVTARTRLEIHLRVEAEGVGFAVDGDG